MYILNEVLLLNAIIKPCCFIWKSLEQVVFDLVGILTVAKRYYAMAKGNSHWETPVNFSEIPCLHLSTGPHIT